MGKHVEIQHTVRKGIEKISVMGDDEARFGICHEESRQVENPLLVEIVGRFVKQENVRLLDERMREQKAGLLAA